MKGNPAAMQHSHDSYRHEAVFVRSIEDYLSSAVSFVRDGVAAGQAVMVAVPGDRLDLLRDAVDDAAPDVHFVDMAELGGNPARIIPAWVDFVAEHGLAERPVRGIGEPIWPGRGRDELAEGELHEALLNLAVAPDTPLWLRCPYDVALLDPAVVEAAHRTHPVVVEGSDYRGSTSYGGAAHAGATFAGELPEPEAPVDTLAVEPGTVAPLREAVRDRAARAGLTRERADDLVLAVHELVVNTLRHGGGRGDLRMWSAAGALVCEVRDRGRIADLLVGRVAPALDGSHGRGLWLANQLCDLVQVRSGEAGTTVRLLTRLG